MSCRQHSVILVSQPNQGDQWPLQWTQLKEKRHQRIAAAPTTANCEWSANSERQVHAETTAAAAAAKVRWSINVILAAATAKAEKEEQRELGRKKSNKVAERSAGLPLARVICQSVFCCCVGWGKGILRWDEWEDGRTRLFLFSVQNFHWSKGQIWVRVEGEGEREGNNWNKTQAVTGQKTMDNVDDDDDDGSSGGAAAAPFHLDA